MNKQIYELKIDIEKYYNTSAVSVRVGADDISMSLKGHFIQEGSGWNQKLDAEIMEGIVNSKVDWNNISKIYRFPNLSLSRDKLTTLKDKYNVKVVRDPNAADVSIISQKTIDKLTSHDYYGRLFSKSLFMEKLNGGLKDCLDNEALLKLTDLMDTLTDDNYIYMGDRYSSWNCSKRFELSKLMYFVNELYNNTIGGVLYINNDNWKQYSILMEPNRTLITDIYVNQVCSEDSVILDWDYYENLKTMLSATLEDKEVAMTLMANCQIEESKTVLGLLFYHYGGTMKQSSTWNQVAFRTLRHQFEHYSTTGWNVSHTAPFSSLIEKLVEDNALTEESMSHICDLVFKKVIQAGVGFGQSECVFEMERIDIRLKSEYKEKMKIENKSLSEVLIKEKDYLPF